jgi:tetratricopeptide (TPR) repeat protein
MKTSWVTLDRLCAEEMLSDEKIRRLVEDGHRPLRSAAEQLSDEELLDKLRGFGLDLDRRSLERLCDGALSAEEVAGPLIDGCGFRDGSERMQGDWIWICLVSLWERWWPDKVCLELVDDKVQAGYDEREHNESACASWLGAWSDVLRLCDATGIRSIEEFDDRFPMTQSLYNWSQDLEDALWNGGLRDREMLLARIAVCEEALRRFPGEDQLMTENRRRALAESYFEMGETEKAEGLFRSWLAADPRWGFGWIGWAACYRSRDGRPKNHGRAEELLRRGYSTSGVRDRDAIAEWLQILCEETGRPREAREFGQQARQLRRQPPPMTVSRKLVLAGQDDEAAVVREAVTVSFGGEGLPLGQLPDAMRALAAKAPAEPVRAAKVERNAPCPCGSGTKFKKCCGSPRAASDPG